MEWVWVFPGCNYSTVPIWNENSIAEGRQHSKKRETKENKKKPINQHGLLVGKPHNRYQKELLSKYAVFNLSQVLGASMTKYEIAVYDVTIRETQHNLIPTSETK